MINFDIPDSWHEWQFLDNLTAYQQSLSPDYRLKHEIKISHRFDQSAYINVRVRYMPESILFSEHEPYDIEIVTNTHEPLLVAWPFMKQFLDSQPNSFFVANSWLDQAHQYHGRVIPSVENVTRCIMYWTNGFYPMSYENLKNQNLPRNKDLIFINGRNDTWRHHIKQLLAESLSCVAIRSNLSDCPIKMLDSQFESPDDTVFREKVNELYPCIDGRDANKENYYSKFVTVGIDNKFGEVLPGYFILPEYFEYCCVMFPESTWQNDELCLTEKACKCFYAESLPWPIGGSNINKLYNQLGFYTAWNILPDHLKIFDSTKDHFLRYQELLHAVKWLEENPDILTSQEAKNMIKQNKENFLLGRHSLQCVEKFAKIINDAIDKKKKI